MDEGRVATIIGWLWIAFKIFSLTVMVLFAIREAGRYRRRMNGKSRRE